MSGTRRKNYTYEPPRIVRAERFITEMPGSSRAVLLEADDGNRYTVKTAHRTALPRLLANEYVATRLAGALHLPITALAIVHLTLPFLRSNFPAIKKTRSGPEWFVPGEAFGSLTQTAVANSREAPALALHAANRHAFASILLFDLWTANLDTRQVAFETLGGRTWAKMIDQGHCFNAGEWGSLASTRAWPLFCHAGVYSAVSTWRAFEPQLGRIEAVEAADVLAATESMPPHWCARADLIGLANALVSRATTLRDRITEVLVARSDLFPRWFRTRSAKPTEPPIQAIA
ncbi:MAG TPA: HipA family kinase [Terriglobales bacterium]|nr:HipA family kinase [Terriglobales bacterium]